MKKAMVTLKCITNLHVGNGDVNYNIIDNEVEKDPVTGYPTINSSGVKGALRAYLGVKSDISNDLFGAEGGKTPGKLKILSANVLAMPLRASSGDNAYYMITTEGLIKTYKDLCKNIGLPDKLTKSSQNESKEISVEGYKVEKEAYEYENEILHILKDSDFRKIALPTLARNKLDNGESKNLWYEEVVSHESIFYFPLLSDDDNAVEDLKNVVDNQIVQFGGNASIGYGLCKLTFTEVQEA